MTTNSKPSYPIAFTGKEVCRCIMEPLVRYQGKWVKITPKPGEPERITEEIAWMKIKNSGATYAEWFKRERNLSKLLYNERPS